MQHDQTPLEAARSYSIDEVARIGKAFADSGYFRDARTPSQAFSKILAGQELGIGPMAAMSMIHVVEGRTTMDATLVAAQIKKSGRYDYRVRRSDETACTLEFFERGEPVGESTFTMEDAVRANLAHRATWRAYPKDMLRSRAMTRGARTFCPDVFNGAIYTPEEIGAAVDVAKAGAISVVAEPELAVAIARPVEPVALERAAVEAAALEPAPAVAVAASVDAPPENAADAAADVADATPAAASTPVETPDGDAPASADVEAGAPPAPSPDVASVRRLHEVTPEHRALVKRVYARLGLHGKAPASVHAWALRSVATTLGVEPTPERWSELGVERLEAYLALTDPAAQAA